MDENKVCFISCVNDDREYEECLLYINHLYIPENMCVELLEIRDAGSMAAGYMEGMLASDAKYKVYMHQDVRIINRNFIRDMIQIFKDDEQNGMIGMVGNPTLPADGIMWHGVRIGESVGVPEDCQGYEVLRDGYTEVEAVDGFLMATQYDLPWRTDLFDGWDFYDISQSMEFLKNNYKVVVPGKHGNWAIHEEKSSLSLWNYNKYRKIFLENYKDLLKKSQ